VRIHYVGRTSHLTVDADGFWGACLAHAIVIGIVVDLLIVIAFVVVVADRIFDFV
jgi:hypothetical protein